MNENRFLADDPRITAYALGELEHDERAAVEAALRVDPTLRAAVAEIRATAGQVEAALAEEVAAEAQGVAPSEGGAEKIVPFPSVGKAAIIPGHDPYKLDGGSGTLRGKVLRFPQVYFIVGGLAAACFAIMAMLNPPPRSAPMAVAVGPTVTTEKVLIDMNALVRASEPAAAAPAVTLKPADGATAVTVAQAKVPAVATVNAPAGVAPTLTTTAAIAGAPLIGPLGQAGNETTAATTVPRAGVGAEGLASGQLASGSVQGSFVGGNIGSSIVNETRGRPGSTVTAVTGISNFDTVAPAGPAVPGAPGDPAAAPAQQTGPASGQMMFLSPFRVSADRFKGAAGAASSTTFTGGANSITTGGTLVGAVDGVVNAPAFLRGAEEQIVLPPFAGRGAGRGGREVANTEAYAYAKDNDFQSVAVNPLSTFSVDNDTASYANVRRFVRAGQRPPRDAVRIEELLNYFPYRYAPPAAKSDAPLAASLEVSEAPWAPGHRLVRVGLKGREVTTAERPAANLVFLLDVSGSMNAANRLPLVKESLRLLLGKLRADDRVAIVTYAGQSGLALPSTLVARAREIVDALESLRPGGATNGAMGIHLAYDIAKANQVTGGINRVILCTDGDFNVGVTSEGELVRLIEDKAKSGVFLTVLGFGMGNLKDSTLEKLAGKGNGTYGYIDSRKEAEKILVQQVNGTLVTIAKDVKIQVEFNPAQVASYRLIGYENRLLKAEDFKNDKVDAGEIGAGHTVTALYEIVPAALGAKGVRREPEIEERRYNAYAGVAESAGAAGRSDPHAHELLTVKVRYKRPDGLLSRRLDFPLLDAAGKFATASPDFKFAAAVAGFGMILRESPHKGTATMANVVEWAEAGLSEDVGGYRSEFLDLARQAEALEK